MCQNPYSSMGLPKWASPLGHTDIPILQPGSADKMVPTHLALSPKPSFLPPISERSWVRQALRMRHIPGK